MPINSFEWIFGVQDTLFMNLVTSTEIVRRKAINITEKAHFNIKKVEKRNKEVIEPV